MKKKLIAATALTFCALFAGAGAAQAYYDGPSRWSEPATAVGNKTATWENETGRDCTKIEFRDGVQTYDVEVQSTLIVVKAGRENTFYENYSGPVSAISGKDISHIIYCAAPVS